MNLTTVTTPAGPLTIAASDAGTVHAAGFTADPDAVLATIAPTARPATVRTRPELGTITKAVTAYLSGELDRLGEIEVEVAALPGTGGFLRAAWRTLRDIHPGSVLTYTELATRAGRPAAVRAAANACARNPAALFVPCHRVRRTGGGLGGYRWGLAVKEWLLAHERAAAGH